MDHLGYPVNRLIRLSYGPFQLGNLKSGEVSEINKNVIKNQLGLMHKIWCELYPENIKERDLLVQWVF